MARKPNDTYLKQWAEACCASVGTDSGTLLVALRRVCGHSGKALASAVASLDDELIQMAAAKHAEAARVEAERQAALAAKAEEDREARRIALEEEKEARRNAREDAREERKLAAKIEARLALDKQRMELAAEAAKNPLPTPAMAAKTAKKRKETAVRVVQDAVLDVLAPHNLHPDHPTDLSQYTIWLFRDLGADVTGLEWTPMYPGSHTPPPGFESASELFHFAVGSYPFDMTGLEITCDRSYILRCIAHTRDARENLDTMCQMVFGNRFDFNTIGKALDLRVARGYA